MENGIIQETLPNGLVVMLKELHTAPIISHWIWYRVGSRDERPGSTGISHWVEHMQFKGTPRYPAGVLDNEIARTGGLWNAFTHMDWTTYYETLPAEFIDLALDLEVDRMVNSRFESEEVETERTVILSELAGNLNEPLYRLGEKVQKAAFDRHPYRNEIIGAPEDLQRIHRDELYHYYRQHYIPNNALVAIAGDFNAPEMIERIIEKYGHLAASSPVSHPAEPESLIDEEKHVVVEGPGSTTYMNLAYRAPSASNPDFFAFTILDSLLCGPTGLNMFGGGGISNKTSRIYQALVEKELAVSARGGMQATIDPFLYEIVMTIRPNRKIQEVLSALDDQIKRLQDDPVSQAEIARAVKQARAMFAYGSENITNQAFWLGYAEMFANYDWFSGYVENLERVRPEDVQFIAQTYLQSNRRVVGMYLPVDHLGSKP